MKQTKKMGASRARLEASAGYICPMGHMLCMPALDGKAY